MLAAIPTDPEESMKFAMRAMAGFLLVLGAAAPRAAAQGSLGVSFTWRGTAACSTIPPAFSITSIPPGAAKLRFAMKDLDVPGFDHGGGTIVYRGTGEIPIGAFAYTGPCPPGGVHRYQWTVEALDASDRVLATGQATMPFPP
jgi:phosphatidylethanolamine-binding protein (PEBP) family uncharacterized protein